MNDEKTITGIFDAEIARIRSFIDHHATDALFSERLCDPSAYPWPDSGGRNIVFKEDVGVEIGAPHSGSVSFLLWTDKIAGIHDGRVTVIGPDLPESDRPELPFGKILLAGVRGFDVENTFQRYREMEAVRYDIDLKGYMMKGASQYQREWSRISREALQKRFSFMHLGGALFEELRKKDYVVAVEAVFVTSNRTDVEELAEIAKRSSRVINAMNKMIDELSFDCDACEFVDVCDEVRELKGMRESMDQRQENKPPEAAHRSG